MMADAQQSVATLANLITLSRLLLLLAVIAATYHGSPILLYGNVLLLVLVFVSDGLDGYVARRRNEATRFGAIFDIASDRVVEISLWSVFVHLGLVPVFILVLFVGRGILVDVARTTMIRGNGKAPFETMTSALGRWLVAGRTMRGTYAIVKAVTFCCLMFNYAVAVDTGRLTKDWPMVVVAVADTMIALSAALCLLRGTPVILEYAKWRFQSRASGIFLSGKLRA